MEDIPEDATLEDNNEYNEPVANHDAEASEVGVINNDINVLGEVAGVDEVDANDKNVDDEEQLHDNGTNNANKDDNMDVEAK